MLLLCAWHTGPISVTWPFVSPLTNMLLHFALFCTHIQGCIDVFVMLLLILRLMLINANGLDSRNGNIIYLTPVPFKSSYVLEGMICVLSLPYYGNNMCLPLFNAQLL